MSLCVCVCVSVGTLDIGFPHPQTISYLVVFQQKAVHIGNTTAIQFLHRMTSDDQWTPVVWADGTSTEPLHLTLEHAQEFACQPFTANFVRVRAWNDGSLGMSSYIALHGLKAYALPPPGRQSNV